MPRRTLKEMRENQARAIAHREVLREKRKDRWQPPREKSGLKPGQAPVAATPVDRPAREVQLEMRAEQPPPTYGTPWGEHDWGSDDDLPEAPPPPPGYAYSPNGKLVKLGQLALSIHSEEGRRIFLNVYEMTGSVRSACDAIGLARASTSTINKLLDDDADFCEDMQAAYDRHRQAIYDSAYRRAVYGYDKPIIGGREKDTVVATERVYSDTLAALFLRRHFTEFKDVGGGKGATINVNASATANVVKAKLDVRKLTRAQRNLMRQLCSPSAAQELDATAAQEATADKDEDAPLHDVIDSNCTESK